MGSDCKQEEYLRENTIQPAPSLAAPIQHSPGKHRHIDTQPVEKARK